jgi:hypothetical protein
MRKQYVILGDMSDQFLQSLQPSFLSVQNYKAPSLKKRRIVWNILYGEKSAPKFSGDEDQAASAMVEKQK